MSERSSLMNALIGAVVSVVTAFLPLSPILGGAVAGYLNRRDGVRVGAISGAMAAVPFVAIVFLGASLFVFVPSGAAVNLLFVLLLVLLVSVLYTVALSAIGGYVGVYLADEFSGGRDPTPYR